MRIHVRDAFLSYGEKVVLDHFSLDLDCPGLTALTGPSGGGAWTAASPWQTRRGCSWMRSAPPLDKGEKLA